MLPCNKKGHSMLHKSLAKWAAVIQRNQPPSNNEERYLSLLVTGQSFERRLIYHLQQADVASKQRKWSTRSNFPADPIELEQHRWINRLESASRFHRLIQSELMGRPKSFKIVQNQPTAIKLKSLALSKRLKRSNRSLSQDLNPSMISVLQFHNGWQVSDDGKYQTTSTRGITKWLRLVKSSNGH